VEDESIRARAVGMIIEGRCEEALELLSNFYGVEKPRVRVGLPRGHASALGCYDPKKRLICLRSSKEFYDPFIVMHEFYHHLRFYGGRHRGTEKGANSYAADSIRYYLKRLGSPEG